MEPIKIELDIDTLTAGICRMLSANASTLHGNPLTKCVADGLIAAGPTIRARVDKIIAEFTDSDEFARRVRQVYRDAVLGEAARIGKGAARAIVHGEGGTS